MAIYTGSRKMRQGCVIITAIIDILISDADEWEHEG